MQRVHIDSINNEDPAKSAKINDDDSIFYQSGKVDYNKIKKGDILSRSSYTTLQSGLDLYRKQIYTGSENYKYVCEQCLDDRIKEEYL